MFDRDAFARDMPLLDRLNGVFVGEYLHVDRDGAITDQHRSHMRTWVDDDGRHQVNTYTWPDGRREVHSFDTGYDGGAQFAFEDARMSGICREADARTVFLKWTRKDRPDDYFYEMAQLVDSDQERVRIWHVFNGDRLHRRVLILERRMPDDTPVDPSTGQDQR